jgi:hypothetical protein
MATERDVIYRLRAAAGDDVSKNLKAFERHVSDAYDNMEKQAGMAARQQVAVSKNATSQITAHLAQQQAAQKQAAQSASAASQQVAASSQRASAATSQSFDQAVGKINSSNAAMQSGFNQSTDGVLKLGRGFAMLGISGEDDVKKILEVLMRVQGVIDVTRGAIELYQGITSGVRAYRSAVVAATAAETALGVARARSAAAGVGAAGAGGAAIAGGAVAGGLIPRAGGALVAGLTGTVGTAGFIVGGIGAGAAVATNAGGSRDKVAAKFSGSSMLQPTGFFGRLGGRRRQMAALNERDRLAQLEQSRQHKIESAGVESQSILGRQAVFGARSEQLGASQGMGFMDDARRLDRQRRDLVNRRAGQRSRIENAESGPGAEKIAIADMAVLADTNNRLLATDKQRLQLAREYGKERIGAAQQALTIAERERDIAKATTMEARNRLKSDLERFDSLNDAEKNRLRLVRLKVNTGATLTRSDTDLAGQFAEFSDEASRARVARARAAGGDAIFTADRAGVAAARTRERSAEALVVKREDKIEIAITRDEAITARLLDEVRKSLAESERTNEKQFRQIAEQVRLDMEDAAGRRSNATGGRR